MMAVSIRLDPEIEQPLDQLASQTGRAKSYYLRELIEGGLNDLEDFYLASNATKNW
jgi:RHH-type rel operon transcriptional repressor/antitoxin RelB